MFLASSIFISALFITGGQFSDPNYADQTVSVSGVVSSVFADDIDHRYVWLTLRTRSAEILAASKVKDLQLEDLRPLIDSEVVLTGTISSFAAFRECPGRKMLTLNNPTNAIIIVRPAADPFGPEACTPSRLHRQCHKGIVTASGKRRFCILTTSGSRLEVRPDGSQRIPTAGDTVLVSGFLDLSYLNPTLTRALCRETGRSDLPDDTAHVITNSTTLNINLHNRLIRLRGIFHHLPDGGAEIAVDNVFLRVEAPELLPTLRSQAPSGSFVELTGVHLLDFKPDPINGFQRLDRLTVIPRTIDDLKVLRLPARRTLVIFLYPIGVLFLTLIVFLVRGRIARKQAELKIRERTRLAVELHDSISQTLTGVALQLENAIDDTGNEEAKNSLTSAERMLAGCRAELQSCLWDLKSRTFDEKTMTEACLKALKPFSCGAHVRVCFNVSLSLLTETEVSAILKIVRELTVNAIRHGSAKTIRIAGECHERLIRFSVTDDGTPFDPNDVPGPADGHFGLSGISERLRAHDGTIVIKRRVPTGMKRTITLRQKGK